MLKKFNLIFISVVMINFIICDEPLIGKDVQPSGEVSTLCRFQSCNSPFTFNATTCHCDCKIECSEDEHLNCDICECVNSDSKTNVIANKCENINCTEGTVLDDSKCECVCEEPALCFPPFEVTSDQCSCQCPNFECPSGFVLDKKCKCHKEELQSCPPNKKFIESIGECVCEIMSSCPGDSTWSDELCRCICCETQQDCKSPLRWDHVWCKCCSNEENCPNNSLFNPHTCECIVEPDPGCWVKK